MTAVTGMGADGLNFDPKDASQWADYRDRASQATKGINNMPYVFGGNNERGVAYQSLNTMSPSDVFAAFYGHGNGNGGLGGLGGGGGSASPGFMGLDPNTLASLVAAGGGTGIGMLGGLGGLGGGGPIDVSGGGGSFSFQPAANPTNAFRGTDADQAAWMNTQLAAAPAPAPMQAPVNDPFQFKSATNSTFDPNGGSLIPTRFMGSF